MIVVLHFFYSALVFIAAWTKSHSLNISVHEENRNLSLIDWFIKLIEDEGQGSSVKDGLSGDNSAVWHVNSLLLEPRYARVSWL